VEDINGFIKTIDNRLPLIIFIYYIHLANYNTCNHKFLLAHMVYLKNTL